MLDPNLKTQLGAYLERVVRPIHIDASVDDGPASAELLELLGDDRLAEDHEGEAQQGDAGRRKDWLTGHGPDGSGSSRLRHAPPTSSLTHSPHSPRSVPSTAVTDASTAMTSPGLSGNLAR